MKRYNPRMREREVVKKTLSECDREREREYLGANNDFFLLYPN